MHDNPRDLVQERRSVAVAQLDRHFAKVPGGGSLSNHDLEHYKTRGFSVGWYAPTNFSDGVRRTLHILVDGDFPYNPPRVAIADGPTVLEWPHLEPDGLICILPADASVSIDDPVRVAKSVVRDARRIIEESINEFNVADFRDEFLSYWDLAVGKCATPVTSILDPRGPGRRVSVYRRNSLRIVGESPETLKTWLSHRGMKDNNGGDLSFNNAVLIWLSKPLVPTEYPQTAADLRTLARERSPESVSVLEELAASSPDEIDVVIGAGNRNGACFAAIAIRSPRETVGPNRRGNPLTKGFRPNRVPRRLLLNRYFSRAATLTNATVKRADHLWIHGRDHDTRQDQLHQTRVAVLGCGSVGGTVAKLLAQSGVGNLLLVDPSDLDWPNTGRHYLGARSVGNPKAVALSNEFKQAHPHLNAVSWRRDRVGRSTRRLMIELASYDLIISTMGNWAAECFLNDWQQADRDSPPILYGWVEPNAAAAHAVLIISGGPCFRCGTNEKGRPHLEVTEWKEDSATLQEPACGAMFTPYGPIQLCWAHALLAEAAMDALTNSMVAARHRIWLGSLDRLTVSGGKWTEQWVLEVGDPGIGCIRTERSWPASSSCPVCSWRAYEGYRSL